MAITGVREAASPLSLRLDAATTLRPGSATGTKERFGPAVTLSLSSDPAAAPRPAGSEANSSPRDPNAAETLRNVKAVALAAKQDIADATRRLKVANVQDAGAAEHARAALDRQIAELSDVVIDSIRASDGADLLALAIGADAIARPLGLNIVV